MLRDRKKGGDAECSTENPGIKMENFNWKQIWKIRGPNKFKMFVWRLAHNSLANRMKIERVGTELDTTCPVCHRLNEDGGHIFLKCKRVKECWSRLGLSELRENLLRCNSAHEMLAELWKVDGDPQLKSLVLM